MNTKRIFKQILPMLLSVVLVIGLTPATAFAVETPPADPVPADLTANDAPTVGTPPADPVPADLTANEAPVTEDEVTDSAPAEEVPEENEPKQELSALAGVNDGTAEGLILQIAKFTDDYLAPHGESLTAKTNAAGDTVTVTGNITKQDHTLLLNLTNLKIVWKATSRSKLTDGPLVKIQIPSYQYYSGTFELAEGGVIWNECYENKNLPAIQCLNNDLIINGGTVRSDYGSAILEERDGVFHRYVHDYGESYLWLGDTGRLQVKSGEVSSLYGPNGAINATCPITDFSISGGRVWSSSTAAITLATNLTVIDSGIVQSDSDSASAIVVNGSGHTVNVRGAGTVCATGKNRNAIFSSQSNTTVSVSGGVVENTGIGNGILLTGSASKLSVSGSGRVVSAALNAIKIDGLKAELNISDQAKVSSVTAPAIHFPAKEGGNTDGSKVNISGGEISSASGQAVLLEDDNIALTTTGTPLIKNSAAGLPAIPAIEATGESNTVLINSGRVESTENGGIAIRNSGVNPVTVKSNAFVIGGVTGATPPALSVPAAPTDVKIKSANGQAQVSWAVPVGNGGSKITEYVVTVNPGGHTVRTSELNAVVPDLTNAVTYTLTVAAVNSVGTGAASAPKLVFPAKDYIISDSGIHSITASEIADMDRIVVRADDVTIKSSGDITLPPVFVDQSSANLTLDGRGTADGTMKIVSAADLPAISSAEESDLTLSIRGKVSVSAGTGQSGITVPGLLRIANDSQADEAQGELTVSGGAYGINAGELKVDRNNHAGLKLTASATDTTSRGIYTVTGDLEATDAILTVTATASGSSAIWSSYGLKIYGGLTTVTGHDSGIYARALGKDSSIRNDADNIIITRGASDPVVNATATGNSSNVDNAPIFTHYGGMTIEHARITVDAMNPGNSSLFWSIFSSPGGSGIFRDCEITANGSISFESDLTFTDSTIDMTENPARNSISAGRVLTIANCDIDVYGSIHGNAPTYATNSITDSDITVRTPFYGIWGGKFSITDSNLILNVEGPGGGLQTGNLTIQNSTIEAGSFDMGNDYYGISAGDLLIDNSTVHSAKDRGVRASGSLSISGASELTSYAGSADALSIGGGLTIKEDSALVAESTSKSGIVADGSVNITDSTVTSKAYDRGLAIGGTGGFSRITNAKLTANTTSQEAIYLSGGTLLIESSDITAHGGQGGICTSRSAGSLSVLSSTIRASASGKVPAGTPIDNYYYYTVPHAIYSYGAYASSYSLFTGMFTNSNVELSAPYGHGLFCYSSDIRINDSKMTVSGESGIYGRYGVSIKSSDLNVTATGSAPAPGESHTAYDVLGLGAAIMTNYYHAAIIGSNVVLNAPNGYGIESHQGFEITGSTVTADGKYAGLEVFAVSGLYGGIEGMHITDSIVNATATSASGAAIWDEVSPATYAYDNDINDITITNSYVTASNANGDAVISEKDVIVNDGGLYAYGDQHAVRAAAKVAFANADVVAEAAGASASVAIQTGAGKQITINGGRTQIDAAGGSATGSGSLDVDYGAILHVNAGDLFGGTVPTIHDFASRLYLSGGSASINKSVTGGAFVVNPASAVTASGSDSVTVNAATPAEVYVGSSTPVTPPVITTASLPAGQVNTDYSQTLAASGSDVRWSLKSGRLPAGLHLGTATGALYGTPLIKGMYSFTILASNGGGSAEKEFSLTVSAAALTYAAVLTPSARDFGSVAFGYLPRAAQKFEVRNSGTGDLTGLTADITSGAAFFEITEPLSAASLAPNASASLSLRPKAGLPYRAVAYTGVVTVSGANDFTKEITVSFTVDKAVLTYRLNAVTIEQGAPVPEFTYTVTGFIGDDTEDSITITKPVFGAKSVAGTIYEGQYGSFTIDRVTDPVLNTPNYTFAYVTASLYADRSTSAQTDKTVLDAAVIAAHSIMNTDNRYTAASYAAFPPAFTAAKAVFETASQTVIDNALNSLNEAIDGLRRDISVQLSIADTGGLAVYTGEAVTRTPVIIDKVSGETLTAGTHYTIAYENNLLPGTATVTITGIASGGYVGTATYTFLILRATPATVPAVTGYLTNNGQAYTYTLTPLTGGQYRMDSGAWQDGNVFSSITPGAIAQSASHVFYVRLAETATHKAGGAGNQTVAFPALTPNDPDFLIASAAKALIENGAFTVAQTAVNANSGALKDAIAAYINALPGMVYTGISVTADDVIVESGSFTPAVTGTATNKPGTNGSFTYTVSLTRNAVVITSGAQSGTITATAYSGGDNTDNNTDPNNGNTDSNTDPNNGNTGDNTDPNSSNTGNGNTGQGNADKDADLSATAIEKSVTKIRTPLTTIYLKTGTKLTPPVCADSVDAAGKADTLAPLSWKSSNTKIATVDPNTGQITAKKTGKVTITATSLSKKTLKITVRVVGKATALKKVSLVKPPGSLKKGKTKILTIKLSPKTATDVKVTYKSSKPKIIKVDKAGKITALKKGKATITVKCGKRIVKKTITVM